MDRGTFLRHLRESRLYSEQEFDAAAARLPESDQARVLARALIAQGLLTRFQARQLLNGKGKKLVLGQYRLLDYLGRGATGRVFKAMHTVMRRVVAIKVLSSNILAAGEDLYLFRREIRAAAQLQHPNIIAAYDAEEAKGAPFLVMEYAEGPNLQELLKKQGPLPIGLACELMRQAAEALQYAHEKGIVHRDIKPANLLVTRLVGFAGPAVGADSGAEASSSPALPPLLKILDFGLARLHGAMTSSGADTIRAKTGTLLGTIDYISPEQTNSIHDVDIRSDLYSLGCTFYHLLAGRVPFAGETAMEKLVKHLMEQPVPLQEVRPEVPPAVASIVLRLMAKDRYQRFQSPAELACALAPWCGGMDSAAAAGRQTPVNRDSRTERIVVDVRDRSPDTMIQVLRPGETPAIDEALREKWRQWTAIVEVSLRRRGSRQWINAQAFQALQEELVQWCRDRACVADERQRDFLESLEELVKPWLTPDTLMQTDVEIHTSLLRLCQQAEQTLNDWFLATRAATANAESVAGGLLNRFRKRRDLLDFQEHIRKRFFE
jgi:serine/threonine protein kinase